MACQMGLRRLFADKRRCAVSDRMTLRAVLVTVFTLFLFDLMLRRPETSATFYVLFLRIEPLYIFLLYRTSPSNIASI